MCNIDGGKEMLVGNGASHRHGGAMLALAAAALFGASTPTAKMLLSMPIQPEFSRFGQPYGSIMAMAPFP